MKSSQYPYSWHQNNNFKHTLFISSRFIHSLTMSLINGAISLILVGPLITGLSQWKQTFHYVRIYAIISRIVGPVTSGCATTRREQVLPFAAKSSPRRKRGKYLRRLISTLDFIGTLVVNSSYPRQAGVCRKFRRLSDLTTHSIYASLL